MIGTLTAARSLAARRAARQPETPAELAARLIPNYRRTATVEIISDAIADAITGDSRRIVITTPPRSGKSVLCSQIGPVWALSRDPETKVILRSYSDELAEEHSREARRLIVDNSEYLGIQLAADRSSAGRWQLAGHRGGMLAGGILTGATGHGADLLIIDDPIKNSSEADSAAYRRRLINEFRSSFLSRLHPGASCVVVLTRWHPEDLAGELLAESGWEWINVPAVSTRGVPDALDRAATGVAMVSALGRTADQLTELRRGVGERAWAALYLGMPAPPSGGLIRQSWFDDNRLTTAPDHPVRTIVGVDPSDSGKRDMCGIVGASLASDGTVCLVADRSEALTSEQWSRRAVELAVELGASEISVEGFATATTYEAVVKDALRRWAPNHPIRVTTWRAKGDAVARSAGLLQGLETGRCRIVGHLPEFESAAAIWQTGQHCPDAVAAAVICFDVLARAAGWQIGFVSPLDLTRRISDRPDLTADRRGLGSPIGAAHPALTRRVTGGGYDPMAYRRVTRRVM